MNEYKINMEHLKAKLFDEMAHAYINDKTIDLKRILESHIMTVTAIKLHGRKGITDSSLIEGGEK